MVDVASRREFVKRYTEGRGRYIRFIEEILDVELSEAQKEIVQSVEDNRQTAVQSANGIGKSFTLACLNLAFFYCNEEAVCLVTSGSYAQMEDSFFSPMEKLLTDAQDRFPFLPGKVLHNPPQIKIDGKPEHYLRCISSKNAKDLEGRHADAVLVSIEEADNEAISDEVIDSAKSCLTDGDDRIVAIGNPPAGEGNSFTKIQNARSWNRLQFSSFDSRNVRVDAGLSDEDKLPGLVDLETVKSNWEEWNQSEWPSFEEAKNSGDEDTLDSRWYRRRLGVRPPDDATAVRPIYLENVITAEERYEDSDEVGSDTLPPTEYDAIGIDIARSGGDRTVIAGVTETRIDILRSIENPGTHTQNFNHIENCLKGTDVPIVVDAVGEGSGIADQLSQTYDVTRFNAGAKAKDSNSYYDKRTESLANVGQWLREEGTVEPDSTLSVELRSTSRNIEMEVKQLRGGTTHKATSKDILKKSSNLGRSPDELDAASLAIWGFEHLTGTPDAGFAIYSYQ